MSACHLLSTRQAGSSQPAPAGALLGVAKPLPCENMASTSERLNKSMNLTVPAGPPGPLKPTDSERAAPMPQSVGISQEQKVELLEYWRSVVKRKWAILGLALAVAVLAGVVSFALTPIYQGSATVLIEAGKVKILTIDEIYTNSQQRENFQTQVEIIKSREVADRTVRALRLWENPLFDPRLQKPSLVRRTMAAIGIGPAIRTTWTEEQMVSEVVGRLMEDVSVVPVRLSQLAKVQVLSPDRFLAAELANAVAREYNAADRDERL